ncbi:NnrS family protein [Balneatrix alpica]|uniref:NnrS family protein n=1 Tax=Balneatrix alpica TaxID=75684 RepID=A0ABV5ZCE4_9GAMM|nr:NnrS family protein [Balneatrix alpica]
MTEPVAESWFQRLFSYAFRPLFALMTLAAIILVLRWLHLYFTGVQSSGLAMPATHWHAHEMLYGLAGAAIAGFLLTAVAKWTNREPVQGLALQLLVLSWLAGRLLMAFSASVPTWLLLLGLVSFWLGLAFLMGRELLAANNKRNIKVVLLLAVFGMGELLFVLGFAEQSIRMATFLVVLMISLIGGRIIPAFTQNWLKFNRQDGPYPPAFNRFDLSVVVLMMLATLAWAWFPYAAITAALVTLAGLGLLVRLLRWQGWRTLKDPLMWSLHLGFAWVALGVLAMGVALWWQPAYVNAGLHALTIGGMMGLILAVAGRAALGHTGRILQAPFGLTLALLLLNGAALLRLFAPFSGGTYPYLLLGAGLLWCMAMLSFAWSYLPILLGPPKYSPLPLMQKG